MFRLVRSREPLCRPVLFPRASSTGSLSGAAAETIVPLILWTLGLTTLFFHLLGKGLLPARGEVVEESGCIPASMHLVDAVFLKTDYENLENPRIQNLARDYREGRQICAAQTSPTRSATIPCGPLLQGAFTIVFAAVFARCRCSLPAGTRAAHPFLAGPGPAILMTPRDSLQRVPSLYSSAAAVCRRAGRWLAACCASTAISNMSSAA